MDRGAHATLDRGPGLIGADRPRLAAGESPLEPRNTPPVSIAAPASAHRLQRLSTDEHDHRRHESHKSFPDNLLRCTEGVRTLQ